MKFRGGARRSAALVLLVLLFAWLPTGRPVVAGAATTATAHAYDLPAQHAGLREEPSNDFAVDATLSDRQQSAVTWDRSVTAASCVAAEGETFVQSAGSSKLLGQNLEASGVARPAETAAHHIVAGGAEAAAPARGVLTQYGIDVNTAENGVFLPSNTGSLNPFGAAVHSTLHTGSYYESVNELLLGATSRSEVMDSLAFLREGLLGGGL